MGIDMFEEERKQLSATNIRLVEDIKGHIKVRDRQEQQLNELMKAKELLSLEVRLLKDETWGQGIDAKLNSNMLEMAIREMQNVKGNSKAIESSTWQLDQENQTLTEQVKILEDKCNNIADALERKREKKKNYKQENVKLKEEMEQLGKDKSTMKINALRKNLEKADTRLRKMRSVEGLNRVMKKKRRANFEGSRPSAEQYESSDYEIDPKVITKETVRVESFKFDPTPQRTDMAFLQALNNKQYVKLMDAVDILPGFEEKSSKD